MKDPFQSSFLPDRSMIAQLPPPDSFLKIRETVERLEELAKIRRNTGDIRKRLLATNEMTRIWSELSHSQRAAVGSELVYDYSLRGRH